MLLAAVHYLLVNRAWGYQLQCELCLSCFELTKVIRYDKVVILHFKSIKM